MPLFFLKVWKFILKNKSGFKIRLVQNPISFLTFEIILLWLFFINDEH